MKINEVKNMKDSYKSCMKNSGKNKIKYEKEITESEIKHKKEINLIKNKLDRIIKKDLKKLKKLNKKKYYKLFERIYDIASKMKKKMKLNKMIKDVKKAKAKNFKGLPPAKMRKNGLKMVKKFKKNFLSSAKDLEQPYERDLTYYASKVLKEKVNLRDIILKKENKSYRRKIRNDIANNDLVRKLCFILLVLKNEVIKTSKKDRNEMTDPSLLKLYDELPFGKSVFDIMEESIQYFTMDFPLDFLEYLDENDGLIKKSDIKHIIDILELIMNFSFNANISKFMTQEQFLTLILHPITMTPLFERLKDDLIETLGEGYKGFKGRKSMSPLFTVPGFSKMFKKFGYGKNNAIFHETDNNWIFLFMDFIFDNETLINKLFESISNLSFIKDIKKFKSIFDDIRYKIESIIEILSLSNNTPKKYLKDLRFLFAAKI
jgi:hypothetical protein